MFFFIHNVNYSVVMSCMEFCCEIISLFHQRRLARQSFPGKDAVLHWPRIRLSWPISLTASCSLSLPYHKRLYSDLRAVLLLGLCSSGCKRTVTRFVVRY